MVSDCQWLTLPHMMPIMHVHIVLAAVLQGQFSLLHRLAASVCSGIYKVESTTHLSRTSNPHQCAEQAIAFAHVLRHISPPNNAREAP